MKPKRKIFWCGLALYFIDKYNVRIDDTSRKSTFFHAYIVSCEVLFASYVQQILDLAVKGNNLHAHVCNSKPT